MGDKLIPMDEKYRSKHYPKGFFAAAVKDARGGGVALIICGAVLAFIGAGILWLLISQIMPDEDFKLSEDISTVAGFGIAGLVFLVPGILIIRYGIKRSRLGENDWIQETAKASGYQENIIRDFANQALEDGSLVLQLGTSGVKGFLTKDYISFHNMIVKIEDIAGAYFVETSYTANINGKTKRMYNRNIKVMSKHKTVIGSEAKESTVKQLLDMLLQKNPAIETEGGRLLSENEFDKKKEELFVKWAEEKG